ncbi:putative ribonuclease H-like domain-containing protein [Tanacetum coccineum]
MSASNQQTLADSGANKRPPILEKGNFIPWESRFRRFLDNKLEEGERMWRSIEKGPYVRLMIPAIPNDIYILVDACKTAQEMWERIKRLIYGSGVTNHVRHSRLMDEFDKFAAKEGESLESVYERLTTLVNIYGPKYVTMVRHNQIGDTISYDQLYDSLVKFEPHVQASKPKRATRNHDPLALIAHSNYSSSQSHASPCYSHSPQPYYVIHHSSVFDYKEYYQGELQGDSQEDKLTTAMMLLARTITQKFSTPPNNRLCTLSNTRNQAVIQDGRIDIQTKNAGYGGNGNKNVGRQNRNQAVNAGNGLTQNDESNQIVQRVPRTKSNPRKANVQCHNCNEKCHYARNCQKPRVRDAKYFREQMLLAMKDEAGSNLKDEENSFMLDNSYGDEKLEELTDAAVSEVNASNKMIPKGVHEHKNHGKRKTVVNTYEDDQTDSNIIFDDPYVENNGGSVEHDSNAHDQYHNLLQKELKTCKERVKTFESKMVQCSKYKETCDELKREIRADKDTIERILKEKNKIESDFFKIENEKIIIQHETQLAKKAFKERENRYLEDIVDLEEKLSSHDQIAYKMGQSI